MNVSDIHIKILQEQVATVKYFTQLNEIAGVMYRRLIYFPIHFNTYQASMYKYKKGALNFLLIEQVNNEKYYIHSPEFQSIIFITKIKISADYVY